MDAKHTPQPVDQFDLSPEARVAHWRGFTMYRHGSCILPIGPVEDGKAIVLGNCKDVIHAHAAIDQFYRDVWNIQ